MRRSWSRRRVLGAAVATSGLVGWPAFGKPPVASEDDAETLFLDNREPRGPEVIGDRGLADWPRWHKQTPRPAATWATGNQSVDNAHLEAPFSSAAFAVDPTVLRRALAVSHIDPATLGNRVLFGIRGATLGNPEAFGEGTWGSRLELAETTPDHVERRCVLGVWDRKGDRFYAGEGSTVCNIAYLYAQAQAKKEDTLCNLMPPGVYRYEVGTHRNGRSSRQPGAFRFRSRVALVRHYTTSPLGFTTADDWQFRGPEVANNIHAAYRPKGKPTFSSAGCQVVEGSVYDNRTTPVGAWRAFRVAAGLKPDPVITADPEDPTRVTTSEDGKKFSYVLLGARELRLAAAATGAKPKALLKLRRGSSGEAVQRLQEALGLSADGAFGLTTQRQLMFEQNNTLGWADGVVTPATLAALGLPPLLD